MGGVVIGRKREGGRGMGERGGKKREEGVAELCRKMEKEHLLTVLRFKYEITIEFRTNERQ